MNIREQIYDLMRRSTDYRTRQWFKRQWWFTPIAKRVFGNGVYSRSYYDDVERIEADSVLHIAAWISKNLAPSRVIDVGCGPGHMMAALATHDIDVFGVDISDAAIERVKKKNFPVERFDLTVVNTPIPGAPYDMALCCEVAEHLDEKYASQFVDTLTRCADLVYLTAAEPDPNLGVGMFHLNEQPNSYWIDLFAARDFSLDEDLTTDLRTTLGERDVISYLVRAMIFRKRKN